eukprot:scaffold348_cov329-Pavlova_lutheri.AAC.59
MELRLGFHFRSKDPKQARGGAMAPSLADRGGLPMRELERQFMSALRRFPKVRGTAVRRRGRDGMAREAPWDGSRTDDRKGCMGGLERSVEDVGRTPWKMWRVWWDG